jgi:hypothetical protein
MRKKRTTLILSTALLLPLASSAGAAPAPQPSPPPAAAGGAGNRVVAEGASQRIDHVVVDDRTDRVIRGALKYLAGKQLPSGSWANDNHQAAITAYVTLAFMACGNLPNEGEYGRTVARGTQFLLNCVRPDGYIAAPTGEAKMYGHGIATICLAEVYGQTRDPAIRPKLERAVKLIIACQNKEGGWRYQPRIADADISVTVLQCVALRSAKNAGLDVPQETIDRAVKYVKSCYDKPSGGFTYPPHNHQPGFARTAAALYSLQVCGLYDDPLIPGGSKYLFAQKEGHEWFSYGNFYAAPAQYMIGGDTWQRWYDQINKKLLSTPKLQRQGDTVYWQPLEGGQGVNDVYATAVYTTILAMPYHYLPLYQR